MVQNLADIRAAFLQFFADNAHEIVRSAPLVPHNDPSLLFTNAGMVPFKNVFTGAEAPLTARAVSSQKCIRAGGKHNDLDNVGYTARHHTFFEMLGNFSFGDYFKEEAIYFAWQFLTQTLGLAPEKLLVTVYAEDDAAYALWKKLTGFSDHKIIRIATADNFWSMGDTGPCGPCSEIFYDHGADIPGGPPGSANEDGDRFVEIWNLVFMQYNQLAEGAREALPKPSIDTGMGLERIASVMQNTHDNYATDLFQTLIEGSMQLTAGEGEGVSHRIIADHLRASAFLIADGVMPSNEGRGYVLRRIMRRAMRHAYISGAQDPLMWRLFPVFKAEMRAAYPELNRAESLIVETLKQEEERFYETLARGLKLLETEIDALTGTTLAGDIAFKLYDTYGFPVDLTQDALRERGLTLDKAGFETAMAAQRDNARAHWAGSGEVATEDIWFDIHKQHGDTVFLGYTHNKAEATLLTIVTEGIEKTKATEGEKVALCFDRTPFYAESGGQIGDKGTVYSENVDIHIDDVQKKLGGLHVLMGTIKRGSIACGDVVRHEIDVVHRASVRAHHSATHLLHAALRHILGDHVAQKGSLVTDHYLRFDFSHPKALSDTQIAALEDLVNRHIRANAPVQTQLMAPDAAIAAGALALFGEKYGDEVRVLSMGVEDDTNAYSVELCGGTHVAQLGEIGLMKITAETAVAAGVRRIEARCAASALAGIAETEHIMRTLTDLLKIGARDVAGRIEKLLDERKKIERELTEVKHKLALVGESADATASPVQDVNGVKFMARVVHDVPAKQLRGLVDSGKAQIGSGIVAFIGTNDGKAGIAIGVTHDLTDRYDAVELVRLGAAKLGGKGGGGRADMAQAGGSDVTAGDAAIAAITEKLQAS